MFRLSLALLLTLTTAAIAAEPAVARQVVAKQAAPAIKVECHGTLKTGIMAIGGETTGIVIVFDRMRWELDIKDPAMLKFAEQNNSNKVVVIGTLRRVEGVEVKERWIVDVEKLTAQAPGLQTVGATVTVTGLLKLEKMPDKPVQLRVEVDGIAWPLNFGEDKALADKAGPMVDKQVQMTGLVDRVPGSMKPIKVALKVSKLDLASNDAPKVK